jgi:FdrA protein
MEKLSVVKRGIYIDSIRLMKATEQLKRVKGVVDAFVSMATETNKELISEIGLLTEEIRSAGPEDLVIALAIQEGVDKSKVLEEADKIIFSSQFEKKEEFLSLDTALSSIKPNLAVVSLPGEEAVEVTRQLIIRGVNVHLFSDHVSIEDEVTLKRLAYEKGVLLLGPGSGTTIIKGKGICFANNVLKGDIGIVASAGTGVQEVVAILDSCGIGISHAFGVGGSDLSERVGGIMTKMCLDLLQEDDGTKDICIISKMPSPSVVSELGNFCSSRIRKRVLGCFLGIERRKIGPIDMEPTLHSCASRIAKIKGKRLDTLNLSKLASKAEALSSSLRNERKYIRGIYSGGTLSHEAVIILTKLGVKVYSNTPFNKSPLLEDPRKSIGNTVVDVGDEIFTRGRAHPMIDPTIKKLRMKEELSCRDVAVLMFDVELGYGVSDNPAGDLVSSIEGNSGSVILARLIGTTSDKQNLARQRRILEDAGVTLCSSNAEMVVLACMIATRCKIISNVKRNWRDIFGI